jgi:hypothetical protein
MGAAIAVSSPCFGQFRTYVPNPLVEAVNKECEIVKTASLDELKTELDWLTSLVYDAQMKAKRSSRHAIDMALRYRRGSPYEDQKYKEPSEKAFAEYKDRMFELNALECFSELVQACLEEQARLLQKERRIEGKWFAHCEDPGGILPDGAGNIDLEILPDNSIRGTVYEPGVTIKFEVFGRMRASGDFDAATVEGQQPIVRVEGQFASFDPLTASGTLWFGRYIPGYANVQCTGRWRAR